MNKTKVKLLISICMVAVLSTAIVYEVSKIEKKNKAEVVESINAEKALLEESVEKGEIVKKEEVKVDNNIENKVATEESLNKEKKIVEDKKEENIKKDNDEIAKVEKYDNTQNKETSTPNRGDNIVPPVEKPSYNESNNYISEIEQAILARVNVERSANGLAPLANNNTMQNYARIKSKDMGDRGYFDHSNPEGELITAQMKRDGVSYNAWGENIAYIQGNSNNASLATQFMTNWMNSQGHRENILSQNFTSLGVGVYKIGNTYYATQEFYR